MPKNTVHGGATNASDPDAVAPDAESPEVAEVGPATPDSKTNDQEGPSNPHPSVNDDDTGGSPFPGDNSSTSGSKTAKSEHKSKDSVPAHAPTTASRSKRG
jgi:hypothetical protein